MNKDNAPPQIKNIGKNLRYLRLERGLTQKNIADALGVSFQQIQKYETGQNKLPIDNLLHLKNFYGITFEAFFEGIERGSVWHADHNKEHEKKIITRLTSMKDLRMKKKILKTIQVLTSENL